MKDFALQKCRSADNGETQVRADVGETVELFFVLLHEQFLPRDVGPQSTAAVVEFLPSADLLESGADPEGSETPRRGDSSSGTDATRWH